MNTRLALDFYNTEDDDWIRSPLVTNRHKSDAELSVSAIEQETSGWRERKRNAKLPPPNVASNDTGNGELGKGQFVESEHPRGGDDKNKGRFSRNPGARAEPVTAGNDDGNVGLNYTDKETLDNWYKNKEKNKQQSIVSAEQNKIIRSKQLNQMIQVADQMKTDYGIDTEVKVVDNFDDLDNGDELAGVYNPATNILRVLSPESLDNTNLTFRGNFGEVEEIKDERGRNRAITKLSSTAGMGLDAIVIHELAHGLDFQGMRRGRYSSDVEFVKLFSGYYGSSTQSQLSGSTDGLSRVISNYSLNSSRECFAETMVAYRKNPEWLRNAQPGLYEYMNTKVKKIEKIEKVADNNTIGLVEIATKDGQYKWIDPSTGKEVDLSNNGNTIEN
jgi:hypothetical protein